MSFLIDFGIIQTNQEFYHISKQNGVGNNMCLSNMKWNFFINYFILSGDKDICRIEITSEHTRKSVVIVDVYFFKQTFYIFSEIYNW